MVVGSCCLFQAAKGTMPGAVFPDTGLKLAAKGTMAGAVFPDTGLKFHSCEATISGDRSRLCGQRLNQ